MLNNNLRALPVARRYKVTVRSHNGLPAFQEMGNKVGHPVGEVVEEEQSLKASKSPRLNHA